MIPFDKLKGPVKDVDPLTDAEVRVEWFRHHRNRVVSGADCRSHQGQGANRAFDDMSPGDGLSYDGEC